MTIQLEGSNSMPPPTVVKIPKGVFPTDEEWIEVFAKAIKTHYWKQLKQYDEKVRMKMATLLAKELYQRSQQCGRKHLASDFATQLQLQQPSDADCQELDALIKEIIIIKDDNRQIKWQTKAYRKLKKVSGTTWANLHRILGIPEPKDKHTGSVAGPRG